MPSASLVRRTVDRLNDRNRTAKEAQRDSQDLFFFLFLRRKLQLQQHQRTQQQQQQQQLLSASQRLGTDDLFWDDPDAAVATAATTSTTSPPSTLMVPTVSKGEQGKSGALVVDAVVLEVKADGYDAFLHSWSHLSFKLLVQEKSSTKKGK